jgi:hypothetical protein
VLIVSSVPTPDVRPGHGGSATRSGQELGRKLLQFGPVQAKAPPAATGEDAFWARFRNLRFGPVTLDLGGQFHPFALDQATDAWYTTGLKPYRRASTGQSGSALGEELDLRVVWNVSAHLELMAGFGHFFPGQFVSNTGPAAAANWLFAQVVYSW